MKLTILKTKETKYLILTVILSFIFFVYLYLFIFIIGSVPTTSMEPTLMKGSIVIGFRTKNIKTNDIVVFNEDGVLMVKRVIGMPGDKVEFKNGILFRNDKKVSEDYVRYKKNDNGTYKINNNEYLLLGDNRLNSIDARSTGKLTEEKNILGKLIFGGGFL